MLVYLASTSPRRHDLLAHAGIDFVAVLPGPEPAGDGAPVQLARQRARSKLSGAQLPPAAAPGLVLAVDTVVDVDGCELGKPGDRAQARHMLRQLAGREHLVHTAHCARLHPARSGGRCELLATARVRVRPLGPAEVEAYLDSGEWADKAGAYGIQGRAASFCTLVEGDLDTVVGLSIAAVRDLLRTAGGERRGRGGPAGEP